jgi:hypothetical protein
MQPILPTVPRNAGLAERFSEIERLIAAARGFY